jgi:hypothetical protein
MQNASSAKPTNLACLSASLNTATVGMPRRRAVTSTLQAISPLQGNHAAVAQHTLQPALLGRRQVRVHTQTWIVRSV